MNFVAGISINGNLDNNAHIDLTILCHENAEFQKSSQIGQITDLQVALQSIFDSLPQNIHNITITTPTYYTEDESKQVKRAAKLAGYRGCHWSDSIVTIQRGLVGVEHPPRAELLVEIGELMHSRLISTEVDSGIRCSDTLHEETVAKSSPLDSSILELVDNTLDRLQNGSTPCGPTLHKLLIVSPQDSITPNLTEVLKDKLGSAQVIVESDISRSAAKYSLAQYRSMLGAICTFNVAPLSVGIAKSDGFVHVLLPHNHTLPNRQMAIFTTEKPGQTHVTVDIVVGLSPRVNQSTIIAKIVLDQLEDDEARRPQIKVTLDVEQDRRTHIKVEELKDDGTARQTATQDLIDIIGDNLDWDDVDEIIAASNISSQDLDDEAEEAAIRWMGEVAAGALPE
ncbi:hypothetical protein BJ165DRAFT_1406341 [Panaeolus papilionaceus]|nr:hypothetical protein BJ165DRAFT_1406341 [Panaeolus papilionaceus]